MSATRSRRVETADAVIVAAWIGTRLATLVAFLAARIIIRHFQIGEPVQFDQGLLAWDGAFYVDIAELGYDGAADNAVRFFPLLPLLIRGLALVVRSHFVAGVLIVHGSALAAGLLTRRLASKVGLRSSSAMLAGALVVAGPLSFTTVLVYTEAVFILLTALVWWGQVEDRPVVSAVAGYMAGLCRPVGALLAIPIVLDGLRNRGKRSLVRSLAPALAPLAGLATFLTWTTVALDDTLAPFDRQKGLRGDASNPIGVLVDHLQDFFGNDPLGDGLHLPAVFLVLILAAVALRRLSIGWGSLAALSAVLFLTAPNLNSIERYAAATLPLIFASSIAAHRVVRRPDLAVAATLSASFTLSTALATLAFLGIVVP